MIQSHFDYVFIVPKTQGTYQPQIRSEFLSILSPIPTGKPRPDLQL